MEHGWAMLRGSQGASVTVPRAMVSLSRDALGGQLWGCEGAHMSPSGEHGEATWSVLANSPAEAWPSQRQALGM